MCRNPSIRRSTSDPARAVPPHRRGPYTPAAWPGETVLAIARLLRALMR
ncbi:hypothetical protein [Luteimonas salinilitoris]|uniref:Uncharacterized protein n=1 Tax=Luteimonas salinilitoris TaxID=3237697 RepID=A0ABV4HN40_9GAMM